MVCGKNVKSTQNILLLWEPGFIGIYRITLKHFVLCIEGADGFKLCVQSRVL